MTMSEQNYKSGIEKEVLGATYRRKSMTFDFYANMESGDFL